MKKKATILILCVGLLTGTAAQAHDCRIISGTKTVVISDDISPENLGICFVVRKGESIDDNENVYVLCNAFSNTDGKIEFSFNMPEEKNGITSDGEYDLYIKERDKAVKKIESFCYASLETRNGFFAEISGVASEDNLKNILEDAENQIVLKAIGCDTDFYSDKVSEIMYESIDSMELLTQEEFVEKYNLSCGIAGFENSARDKAETDKLLKVINPSFEDVGYREITDGKLTDWLSSYFIQNRYSEKSYETANILYQFNTVVSDKIDDLFAKYDTSLGITENKDYTKYSGLTRKAAINQKIANTLASKPAMAVNELITALKNALNNDSAGGSGGGGGGTGGGSGGGSTGGSSNKTPSVTTQNPIVSGIPTDTQAEVSEDAKFKDINSAEWAKKAVVSLAKAGIVSGDENGNFRPNDYINREEFVTMLVLASNKYNKEAVCDFEDVPKDSWFYTYVASANSFGVVHGINENQFGTGLALTRQDMAVLCLRAKGDVPIVRDPIDFSDGNDIADYAKDAVDKLYMSGAVSGMGENRFSPLGQATRAECAQIIFNLFLK